MEIFGFSAEIPKNTWKFLDFQQKSKKTHGHPKFAKVFGAPNSFGNLGFFLEILDFLKFWYVVTTESPLFNKLLIKSLYKIMSGHVFRIRDLIDF